jgi:hypothetical protein
MVVKDYKIEDTLMGLHVHGLILREINSQMNELWL